MPVKRKINQHVANYNFISDNFYSTIKNKYNTYYFERSKNRSSLLMCNPGRTKDSLFIYIINPRKLKFNYFIYAGNKELQRGYTDSLFYTNKASHKKMYSISIEYLWKGKMVIENYDIPYYHNMLSINVEQPKVVYPGEISEIELTVTNSEGEPVPNVDITAFALTRKFNYSAPHVPAFQEAIKYKQYVNRFKIESKRLINYRKFIIRKNTKEGINKIFRLDTMEYNNFLYPKNTIYYSYETTTDSVTQFAPFIFNHGQEELINIIYVDKVPVYFTWTNNIPYSFRIARGYHTIELRTYDKLYKLDSIYFPPYKKTILSFSPKVTPKNITTFKIPSKLSKQEKKNLYRYFMYYRLIYKYQYVYLKQNENIFYLDNICTYYRHFPYQCLIGPIYSGDFEVITLDSMNYKLKFEPYFEYEFLPKLVKMRKKDIKYDYPKTFKHNYGWLNTTKHPIDDTVYTEKIISGLRKQYINYLRKSGENLEYNNSNSYPPLILDGP